MKVPMTLWFREHYLLRRPGWRLIERATDLRDFGTYSLRALSTARQRQRAIALVSRLPSGDEASFPETDTPRVSIILQAHHDSQVTNRDLASIWHAGPLGRFEVIVSGDHISANTELLPFIPGTRFVDRSRPAGRSGRSVSQARSEFMAFVGSNVVVLPGWLEGLLDAMRDETVGASGSVLVYPSRKLCAAGGLVWNDGTYGSIGRMRSASDSEFSFRRDVDFCSAKALMVRSRLLRELGYLTEAGEIVQYEAMDLCFGIRKLGYRVVCEPTSMALLIAEPSSNGARPILPAPAPVRTASEDSRRQFTVKWSSELAEHVPRPPSRRSGELRGSQRSPQPRILVCDRFVPTPDRDSGSQRMDWMLRLLEPMTSRLTLVPLKQAAFESYAGPLRKAGIEVVTGSLTPFRRFAERRESLYDMVILSRHDVANARLGAVREFFPNAEVVFDTVDLASIRLERQFRVTGLVSADAPERARALEARVVSGADLTTAVTEEEALQVQRLVPGTRALILPNVHGLRNDEPPVVTARNGLLFVGGFRHDANADAVGWFAEQVLPLIRRRLAVELTVVGERPPPSLIRRCGPHVHFAGWLANVEPLYDTARVFVAPLRYGAGMKGKVGQALALGLPTVTTTIGAEGMDLSDGENVLIRDAAELFAEAVVELYENAGLWATLSHQGRAIVAARWTPAAMQQRLENLLRETIGYPQVARRPAQQTARAFGAGLTRGWRPAMRIC